MKKLLNIIKKICLHLNGFLATLLTLLIIVIMALQGFVFWLNTDKGGAWLSTKINSALENSGYALVMDDFSLAGILGVKAGKVQVMQGETNIASSDNFSLSINPLPLGLKKLDITLKAKQIQLLSIPVTKDNEDAEEEKMPLTELPDLYFSQIDVRINIAQMILSETIIGGGFKTRIEFKQAIDLTSNKLSSRGLLELSDTEFNQAAYVPQKISNAFEYSLEDQTITVDDIGAESESYALHVSGFYNLAKASFDTKMEGSWGSADPLSPDLQTPIALDGSLAGFIDDFSGQVLAKTTYKDIETTFQSSIERKQNLLSIKDIKGQGGALNLNGALDYDLASGLATGEIKAALPDLNFLSAFVEDLNLSGDLTASAKLTPQDGKQVAALSAQVKNMGYDTISVQTIGASVNVGDVKNLQSARAEVILNKGRVGDIELTKMTLNASSAETGYKLSMRGAGYSINPFKIQADALLKTPSPLDVNIVNAELKMGAGAITAKGAVTNDNIDIKMTGNALNLNQMAFADLSSLPITLDALSIAINGAMAQPVINASYVFRPTAGEQYAAKFQGNTAYNTGQLTNTISGTGKGVTDFLVNMNVPLNLSLSPFAFDISKQAQLSGGADIQSDLKALSGLFLDDGYDVSGQLSVKTAISGTLENPLLDGNASLQSAAFTDNHNDIEFLDIEGAIAFKDRQINLTRLSAKDANKKGTLNVTAALDLQNMSDPDVEASIKLQDMQIIENENYDARLNADIRLETKIGGYLVSGTLTPQDVSIRIPNQFDAAIPQLNIVEAQEQAKPTDTLFTRTKLDIAFKADDKIFVSGRGLDAGLAGNLTVKGTLKDPLVDGNLEVIRGRFEEFGRRFALDTAILRFQGAVPPSPYLNVVASTDIDDTTAKIVISNSVLDPQIKLESSPSLPEDEVLSLILFGEDIQKISPFQAIQLANTLRKLSGKGGGFDPLQQIKSATGLDDIRIDTDSSEGVTVGAGKYISDKVYLEVEQGTAEASGAVSVEIEITPSMSVESKAAQNGESDIGVSWEWNY